jgi:hypothetical protein
MTDLSEALAGAVAVLEGMGIPYAVMGGIAVRAHGLPRATYDVDIIAAIPRDRLPEFFAALTDRDYTIPEPYQRGWVDEVAGMPLVKGRVYLQDRGVDIDLFLAETDFQKRVLERRQKAVTSEGAVWIVSVEDVLLLKLLANRLRDRADVLDVLLAQGQLDEGYLQEWAAKLGVQDRLAEALAEHRKMS